MYACTCTVKCRPYIRAHNAAAVASIGLQSCCTSSLILQTYDMYASIIIIIIIIIMLLLVIVAVVVVAAAAVVQVKCNSSSSSHYHYYYYL